MRKGLSFFVVFLVLFSNYMNIGDAVFEYVSNAPIGVKGLGREVGVAARMGGSYFYVKVGEEENVRRAVIGDFHFLLEEE